MLSTLKNYYASLDKWQRTSYICYGAFYIVIICMIAAYNLLLSENPPPYSIALIRSVIPFLFGMGGVTFFIGSIHINKKINLGLMALTLLTVPMLGLILWFFFSPAWENYLL